MAIETHVYTIDMSGRGLPNLVSGTYREISQGLARRLVEYAKARVDECGFDTSGMAVQVYTLLGDVKPADRSYVVRFTNQRGGYIEVVRILTYRGWPNVDFGLRIGKGDPAPCPT